MRKGTLACKSGSSDIDTKDLMFPRHRKTVEHDDFFYFEDDPMAVFLVSKVMSRSLPRSDNHLHRLRVDYSRFIATP